MRLGENLCKVASSADTLSATGDSLEFRPAQPVRVLRWGYLVSTAIVAGSGAAELNLNTHDSSGSATETAADETLTMADAVMGEVLYVQPTDEIICRPGDYLQIEVTTGATSGAGYGFIEYQPLPIDLLGALGTFPDDTVADSVVRWTDCTT